MYKTVVGCCEGRPNQFLKTGVREEALSIIINLSAALICLFLSLSPIHYLHFRSTIPFLFCVVFVHLSFSPPLLHSSPPLLVFWLISPCPVFQCFSMWILLFTNKPDKPEWKADTRTPGRLLHLCSSHLHARTRGEAHVCTDEAGVLRDGHNPTFGPSVFCEDPLDGCLTLLLILPTWQMRSRQIV